MNDIVISSEAQFREELKKLNFGEAGLLFRGQADANWPVNCSAVRRLARGLAQPVESRLTNSLLVGYLEFLIAKARMLDVLPHGFDSASPDLELLALLQHQGAATGLIDFTLKPFVALWFACNGSQTDDGAVYFRSRASTTGIEEPKDIEKPVGSLYEKNVLWSWEPSAFGSRIAAQSSVFVFGVAEVGGTAKMGRFIVHSESKSGILSQLESIHGINEETLYPDFPGYAVANASDKFFDAKRTVSYWQALITLATTDSERAEAHYNCGVAYSALKEFEGAIKHYDMTISYNPDDAKTLNNLGVAQKSLGLYKEAIANYDKAILLNPEYVVAYNNRGNAKERLGRHKAAIADYDEALRFNPGYVEAYKNRALAYTRIQRYKDAISDCDIAISIEPRYADPYHIRGDAKVPLGKFGEAIGDYDEAIRFNSENAKTYNNRGCAKAIIGLLSEAIKDFQEAIRIDPKYEEARRHLKQAQTLAQDRTKSSHS
ncbi:MAG: tetratricopeptide repeat protein [Caldilineaceae bacterium]|nr:tetratricopeptide repeat protein [Caldilineaceae bacterium]